MEFVSDELCEDTLNIIFKLQTIKGLLICSETCKFWKQIIDSNPELFWGKYKVGMSNPSYFPFKRLRSCTFRCCQMKETFEYLLINASSINYRNRYVEERGQI